MSLYALDKEVDLALHLNFPTDGLSPCRQSFQWNQSEIYRSGCCKMQSRHVHKLKIEGEKSSKLKSSAFSVTIFFAIPLILPSTNESS